MRYASTCVLGLSMLCSALAPASAGTLTDISFASNGGGYINDTIVNGTSPLAFTANTNLIQPFLNAPDSSIILGFGSYYAIAFLGFGQHIGAGSVSFRENGGPLVTQIVTFPNPALVSGVFANFTLPTGDTVTIAATGLAFDRISIVADGGGLTPGGATDAFYAFNYAAGGSPVPEPASMGLLGVGLLGVAVMRRRSR